MTSRHFLYLLPLLVFLGLSVYFAFGLGKDPSKLPSALLDKPVPQFDLPPLLEDLPGLATADFGGEVVMVNVFASWCIPCRLEHPLKRVAAAFQFFHMCDISARLKGK